MIERITRGLFYHEFKYTLPSEIDVEVTRYRNFKKFESLMTHMPTRRLGVQFSYSFVTEPEIETDSVWFYEFHQSECVMALTGNLCHVALPKP